jgi:hypothetical protein
MKNLEGSEEVMILSRTVWQVAQWSRVRP